MTLLASVDVPITWEGNVNRSGQRFVTLVPIDMSYFACRTDFLYVLRVIIHQFTGRRRPGFSQSTDIERLIFDSRPLTFESYSEANRQFVY